MHQTWGQYIDKRRTSKKTLVATYNTVMIDLRADGLWATLAGLAGHMRPVGRHWENAGVRYLYLSVFDCSDHILYWEVKQYYSYS